MSEKKYDYNNWMSKMKNYHHNLVKNKKNHSQDLPIKQQHFPSRLDVGSSRVMIIDSVDCLHFC